MTDRCVAIPTNILIKPAFAKLAKTLDVPPRLALGMLTAFYCWVPTASYEGNLAEFDTDDMEAAAGWTGDKGAFIDALVTHGFLGSDGQVADWPERFPFYAGALRRRAFREAKKQALQATDEAAR